MDLETKFIAQLNEKQKIANDIAKRLLESTYNIQKCNGFKEFKKSNPS